MKIRHQVVALAVLLARWAGAQTPVLTGNVYAEPNRGLLEGEVCLAGFAPRVDLRFLLSAALNVKVITDGTGESLRYRGEYNGRIVGEGREYVVVQPDTARPLEQLCVSYRGAVPSFDRNIATTDWKGRITSMGGVLRAAEQTKWYPTLYDSASGRMETEVAYDLTVTCDACKSLYVNGARPASGDSARFTSRVPRQLLLLAGDFSFLETPDMTFVAGAASPGAVRAYSGAVREIAEYYQRLLGIPYRDRPTLLTFRSVWRERPDGQPMWQFVTWPTIGISGGIAFDDVLEPRGSERVVPSSMWTTLSHEMGHYYFGTVRDPVGPLRWFLLESMAEYLSLKAVAALQGPAAGARRTAELLQGMGTETLPTLDQIRQEAEITGTYRYQYAPAFLDLTRFDGHLTGPQIAGGGGP